MSSYINFPNPVFPSEAVAGPKNPFPVGASEYSTDKDAFGRLRVSLPQVVAFGGFEYGINSLFYETSVTGGASVTGVPAESSIALSTGGTTSGAKAIAQTRAFSRYVPGRSQLVRFTGSFSAPIANVRQRAGKFCSTDGIFFEYDGTTLNFVRRSSTSGVVVDDKIPRSQWADKFDGTGPSGATLDFAGGTTWLAWIDLEWLGVGRYRFGFASPLTGALRVAYEGAGTGVLTVPYMRTANLPTRYEIENTGAAAEAKTLKWICHSDDTEGGDEGDVPLQLPVDSGFTAQALANGTFKPIIALRARATGPNGVANRAQIIVRSVAAAVSGNSLSLFRLILNPSTLTANGGAVSWTQTGNIAEFAVFNQANDTVAGGLVVGDSFYVPASASIKGASETNVFKRLPLVYTELGSVQDTLVLVGAGVGATSAALGEMSFKELF
jgi:hypothetical protein